jgi:hypothetical protein
MATVTNLFPVDTPLEGHSVLLKPLTNNHCNRYIAIVMRPFYVRTDSTLSTVYKLKSLPTTITVRLALDVS